MKPPPRLIRATLILAAALPLAVLPVHAQEAPLADTTVDALVEALTPGAKAPLTRGIKLTPVAPPSVDLAVGFAYDSADLSEDARALLATLGEALADTRLSGFRFAVAGHTDAVGGEAYNEALSRARAQSVSDFLTQSWGIAPDRLDVEGFGETQLLFPEAPEDGRNRRVEITTLE